VRKRVLVVMSLVLSLAACSGGSDSGVEGVSAKPPTPAVAALMQAQAPTGAIEVAQAKAGGPADKVAVRGRISTVTTGRAAFGLMDTGIAYCGEKHAESCKTPWDYCCEKAATRTANTIVVEARGADGQPLATPSLGDLRLLDLVVVTGKLVKDEHGNFTLLATGWHRQARPKLPAGLRWPAM
jgi:hypothetical protein